MAVIKIGLDSTEANRKLDALTAQMGSLETQLERVTDAASKLGGWKGLNLNIDGNFQDAHKSLSQIREDISALAGAKTVIDVRLPTKKSVEEALKNFQLPSVKVGVKLKVTKKELQEKLDSISGLKLNVGLGAGGKAEGMQPLASQLSQISSYLKKLTLNAPKGTEGSMRSGKTEKEIEAYAKNADARVESAKARTREMAIRESYADEDKLLKAQRAMRNQLDMNVNPFDKEGSWLRQSLQSYHKQLMQGLTGNGFPRALKEGISSRSFQKRYEKRAVETSAFKATGKSKLKDLTSKEKASVTTELTKSGELKGIAQAAAKLGGTVGTVVAVVGKVAKVLGKLGSAAVDAYEGVQMLQTQLGVVFGSKAESGSMFADIEAYAKKSPFGVETMTSQAVLLRQSGVYSSELLDIMSRIGDISSGNNEKMRSISETYARVLASTTVTARDMRQLANAGVPIYREMAEQLGVGQNQVRSMLQAGKVKSSDLTAVLKKLTDEGGAFHGATEVGAKTVSARKQNLSDANQMAQAAAGRFITEMGMRPGSGPESSYYSKVINFLDGILNSVERGFNAANYTKAVKNDEEVYGLIQAYYENLEIAKEARGLTFEERSDFLTAREFIYSKYENQGGSGRTNYTDEQLASMEKDFETEIEALLANNGDLWERWISDSVLAFENLKDSDKVSERHNYEWALQQSSLISTMQTNADALDAVINAIGGSVDMRQKAQTAWEGGTLGKAYEQRSEYEKNAALRARLEDADARFLRNGAYEFAGASLKELSEAFELLAADSEKLDLSLAGLLNPNGTFRAEKQEDLELARSRLGELTESLRRSAEERGMSEAEFIGSDSLVALNRFSSSLTVLSGLRPEDIDRERLERFAESFNLLVETLKKADADGASETLDAFSKVMTRGTLSSSGKEYLNKRMTASLWAQIMSTATGIDATRLTLDGRKAGMDAYRSNLSQRQMFEAVAEAMLKEGASFGSIASNFRRTGTGYDGTSLYDWNAGWGAVEGMARRMAPETQRALIDSYQSQIDTLNKLEVAGLATVDAWSDLEYISQGLGSAFDVTATRLADGTYRFTDETIRAVEEMKTALSAKVFREQVSLAFREGVESVRKSIGGTQLSTAVMSGGWEAYSLKTAEERAKASEIIEGVIGKIDAAGAIEAARDLGNLSELISLVAEKTDRTYETESTEWRSGTRWVQDAEAEAELRAAYDDAKNGLYAVLAPEQQKQAAMVWLKKYLVDHNLTPNNRILDYKKFLDALSSSPGSVGREETYSYPVTKTVTDTDALADDLRSLLAGTGGDSEFANAILKLAGTSLDYAEINAKIQDLTEATNRSELAKEALSAKEFMDSVYGGNAVGYGDWFRWYNGENTKELKARELGTPLSKATPMSAIYGVNSFGAEARLSAMGLDGHLDEGAAYRTILGNMGWEDRRALKGMYYDQRYGRDIERHARTARESGDEDTAMRLEAAMGNLTSGDPEKVADALAVIEEHLRGINEASAGEPFKLDDESMMKFAAGAAAAKEAVVELGESLRDTLKDSSMKMLSSTFDKLGASAYKVSQNLQTGAEAEAELANNVRAVVAEMLSSMGTYAMEAGFKLIASGGKKNIALGLALIAAGGFGHFLGGYLNEASTDAEENEENDEFERLQRMKDSLADLLKQARDDAAYYETTLRSRRAIATNEAVSSISVHDMILTPQGQFSTDPDDYIIASKDPSSLGGGGYGNISVNVINTGNSRMEVESVSQRRNGSDLELDVVVNGMVKQAMAEGEYDDVFRGMEERQRGYTVSA